MKKESYSPPYRFTPHTIEELSKFLKDETKPIFFGVGRHGGGARTAYSEARRELDQNDRLNKEADRDEAALSDSRSKRQELLAGIVELDLRRFTGVLELDPSDQVVRVAVETRIDVSAVQEQEGSRPTFDVGTLQHELMKVGQCLPFAGPVVNPGFDYLLNQSAGNVGRGVALNYPHLLEAQCGSWRDWVLGMTIVLADGTIAKSGSKVVKSVAGYDVHKLMIGARDTLAIVVDVTLRTFPIRALPEPDVTPGPVWENCSNPKVYTWVQRVRRSDYKRARDAAWPTLAFCDNATCTLWCRLTPGEEHPARHPGDWVRTFGWEAPDVTKFKNRDEVLMRRAKEIFDPTHKLNPGAMGIF